MTLRLLLLTATLLTQSACTSTLIVQQPESFPPPPPPDKPPANADQITIAQDPETEFIGVVYDSVSTDPVLIGGISGLMADLSYPKEARQAEIEGKVYLKFVVDKNGDVRNATVTQGIGGGCDEEALRVVRKSKFEPGRQDGQVVNTRMSMSIAFYLR